MLDILRQRLLNVCHSIEQNFIHASSDQWRARLKAGVRVDGENQEKTHGSSKITKSVWQWTLLWPVIVDKTTMQQNRVKSLHGNGDPLEQKRRSSNIPVVSATWRVLFLHIRYTPIE